MSSIDGDDEVPEAIRRMVRSESKSPPINPVSEEIVCVLRDVKKYSSRIFDGEDSMVPTTEAYQLKEMRDRREFYKRLGWYEATEFLEKIMNEVEGDDE